MALQPVSSTRVTDALTRQRLTSQIQSDQAELDRLQTQLSTGKRLTLPSDDAASAQRAITLQRTIERKAQSLTNLEGASSTLTVTDGSLQEVSSLLADIRGSALGVVSSTSSDSQRQAVVQLVDQALTTLIGTGNSSLTGSYLFSGLEPSRQPYARDDRYVEYRGDEGSPQTYVDAGLLFETNLPGDEALGGLSEAVRGSEDLSAQLTYDTPVRLLNQGRGVSPNGSIEIVFDPTAPGEPTKSAVIALGSAETVGDLARLIESQAPAGAGLTVTVSGNGLRIASANGTITVGEAAEGSTARELGILHSSPPVAAVTGSDLDPTLTKTTPIGDLIGTRSRGILAAPGSNNDLVIEAASNGAAFNNLTVRLVGGATAGSESASYDAGTNTLTVSIAPGESKASQVAAAISAEGTFRASTDYRDALGGSVQGAGTYAAGDFLGVTDAAGSGRSIDLAGGLVVRNGGDPVTVDTSAVHTVEDLLSLLNKPGLGLVATVNSSGTGIDVRSRRSGADFSIGENGGSTATDLGIRTTTGSTRLADFAYGVGVVLPDQRNTFHLSVTDQGTTSEYDIDLTGVETVDDLRAAISAATGGAVQADLATVGNGLTLRGTAASFAGAPAAGAFSLGGDTLSVQATGPGAAGNAAYTVEVVDSGAGGLATAVVGGAITVDLGGAAATSDLIAASIQAALTGVTVTSSGTGPVAPTAQQPLALAGGADPSTAGFDSITVTGDAAERFGFAVGTASSGSVTSADSNPARVDSVFDTLLRLRDALAKGDEIAIGNQVSRLDADISRVNFARGEVGSRLQNLDSIRSRLKDEDVNLRAALSKELDVDYVDVISQYTSKQYALQASLKTAGSLLQQTILDYLSPPGARGAGAAGSAARLAQPERPVRPIVSYQRRGVPPGSACAAG